MSSTPSCDPDDPYPHAADLAVTGDGKGLVRPVGSPLTLHVLDEHAGGSVEFTWRPRNVAEGCRAPAPVGHTTPGRPTLAPHDVVTCLADLPAWLCVSTAYAAWRWRQVQAMAKRPAASPGPVEQDHGAPERLRLLGPCPCCPCPLAPCTPHRRRAR
ncbi:hypothetical protein GCM10008960_34900 [Deinococcus sedimenti]|uniref:Uncharacterized protein n=1 Tax=Deinococcus sedimenti TaxID=1867090 RepID=A0ABQ2SAA1_9DEIO|nr:hypothetical protein GCM10008960_34900 [Deinococcus sedimenti]